MNTEQFEQLVSEWLDSGDASTLRAAVDAALTRQPALHSVLRNHERLQSILRQHAPGLDAAQIDWPRLRSKLSAAVGSAAAADSTAEAPLDEMLAKQTALPPVVDWARFQRATAARVAAVQPDRRPTTVQDRARLTRWFVPLAAAAVVLLMLTIVEPNAPEPAPGPAVAQVTVRAGGDPALPGQGFARVAVPAAKPGGVARVTVSVSPPDGSSTIDPDDEPSTGHGEPAVAFFTIDPMAPARGPAGAIQF